MNNKPSPSTEAQSEAMSIAKATQKPGQTKDQTKLIAQGIAKGIAQYKKQQKERNRKADKAKKQERKQKAVITPTLESHSADSEHNPITTHQKRPILPWGLLFMSWVGFVSYWVMTQ
ncbi:DUF2956 domain-containing protein [Vibrio sp. FNV 38]|nr:DUF2956 domain-containing protein [Vibrio sp. FNV 38]